MTKDITGQQFGRLMVLRHAYDTPHKKRPNKTVSYWECQCECGNICYSTYESLVYGTRRSCGCLRKELMHKLNEAQRKYLPEDKRIARIWRAMIHRCENPIDNHYNDYGGRGIMVCEKWHDYENFRKWARENGYADNLSIDRIDYNGNYCPENCRWRTQKEQCNNTRTNKYLEYKGEIHTLSEWCDILGLNYFRTKARLNTLKWTVE